MYLYCFFKTVKTLSSNGHAMQLKWLNSYCVQPIPWQSVWDLWWAKWHHGRFFSEYL